MPRSAYLKNVKTIVVKVGSSLITDESGISKQRVGKLVDDVVSLLKKKYRVVIVSSGAISAGSAVMKKKRSLCTIPEKQALAAIGQSILMDVYRECFNKYGFEVGQILLTEDDVKHRRRFLNARHTLQALLEMKVVPIVNENDSVVIKEIKFGDNDKWNSFVPIVSNNILKWGHAICALPWAFFIYQGKKAILIQDSHGTNVGWQGRKILTEDWFKERIFQAIYFEDLNNLAVFNNIIKRPKYTFKREMKVGMQGKDIAMLQVCLATLQDVDGYLFPLWEGKEPTGFFGGITRNAIQRYQELRGLEITGLVNQETLKALNKDFN